MARGINKVILIGNLGKDPELRRFPSGDAVCNVTVATTDGWTDKVSGEKKERTEWHNVVFNRKLAEIVAQYLRKGSKVYIEGSLRTRKWEKDGVDRYTTEIIANEMQMLDSRSGGTASMGGDDDYGGGSQYNAPAQAARPSAAPRSAPPPAAAAPMDAPFEDDDIPF